MLHISMPWISCFLVLMRSDLYSYSCMYEQELSPRNTINYSAKRSDYSYDDFLWFVFHSAAVGNHKIVVVLSCRFGPC